MTTTNADSEQTQPLGLAVDRAVRPHSAAEAFAAFEWLREFCTADGAPEQAGIAFDCWHAASKALRELVECKALADQFDALKEDVHDFATAAVLEGIKAEYQRRKPAAWAAARVALGLNVGGEPQTTAAQT